MNVRFFLNNLNNMLAFLYAVLCKHAPVNRANRLGLGVTMTNFGKAWESEIMIKIYYGKAYQLKM